MNQPDLHNLRLVLVAAVSDNDVIGQGGDLPWHLPEDLKHFKAVTMGHAMLMGRRTFDSLGGALPGRDSFVLTRDPQWQGPNARRVASLEQACEQAAALGHRQLCVVGGAEVYALALPHAHRLELTRVLANVEGDTYWPQVDWNAWRLTASREHPADERHAYPMRFEQYDRR